LEQPTNPEAPITVAGLCKSFGEQAVLDGIAFQLEPRKVTCVLGRSGTGKSVLLRLLIGIEKPDAGSICLEGHDISTASAEELNEARKKVGFLFQQSALYDSMTIEENVAFPLRRHTKLSDAERRDRVHQLLGNVGMDRDLEKMPSDISGGMQKRVGLARAIASDPQIIFFDEPTTGLDPIMADIINDLIISTVKDVGATALSITHDMVSARKISDHIAMLYGGKIIWQGPTGEIDRSHNPYVDQFIHGRAEGPIKMAVKA
jgi:phospholipid/cholesterol/gamma-HCH transport system ATP-binding protein